MTVETDRLAGRRIVQAGSGFLSQHSKELLFGLGASQRVVRLTVEWPSGLTQTFTDVPLDHRVRIEEGGEPRAEPYRDARQPLPADVAAAGAGGAAERQLALRALPRSRLLAPGSARRGALALGPAGAAGGRAALGDRGPAFARGPPGARRGGRRPRPGRRRRARRSPSTLPRT